MSKNRCWDKLPDPSIILILICTGIQGFAEENEICACVGVGGIMRFVGNSDHCKPPENRICWNIEGPQGAPGEPGSPGEPGPPGPEGPPGQGCIRVYTAEGELMGILVNYTGHDTGIPPNAVLYISTLGKFFQFSLGGGTNLYRPLINWKVVYFETPDCSGTPYIKSNELYDHERNFVNFVVKYRYPENGMERHYIVEKLTTGVVAQSIDDATDSCEQCVGGNCIIGEGNFRLTGVDLPFAYDEGVSLPVSFE